jgi:hypothetical protein
MSTTIRHLAHFERLNGGGILRAQRVVELRVPHRTQFALCSRSVRCPLLDFLSSLFSLLFLTLSITVQCISVRKIDPNQMLRYRSAAC